MCLCDTPCDDRCKNDASHMHCHHCGWALSFVFFHEYTEEDLAGMGFRDLSPMKGDGEALWECTNPECGKDEVVMSGLREYCPDDENWNLD